MALPVPVPPASQNRALGADVLTVGKYLSPKLYVGYGVSLLGTGQVLMLEYLLRKGFDIQIESGNIPMLTLAHRRDTVGIYRISGCENGAVLSAPFRIT